MTAQDQQKLLMTELKFAQKLIDLITRIMLDEYHLTVKAEQTRVLKTNGELTGITVRPEGENVAPTIYTAEAYSQYCDGRPIEEIAKSMAETVHKAFSQQPELPDLTPEEAREHIRLVVINTERNEQLLSKTPHFEVGDLSAIPRWYISDEASFVVNNDMAANLQLTPDEVLQIGRQNLARQEYEIRPMRDVLRELMDMDEDTFDMMFPDGPGGPELLVLTTPTKIQGSAALLDEDTLQQVYEKLGGEYYVLPSSIHELLCMPADSGMSVDEIKAMVMEVNATQVAPQDFLSDNIQKYDGQKLQLVIDDLRMDSLSIEAPKIDEPTVRYAAMTF